MGYLGLTQARECESLEQKLPLSGALPGISFYYCTATPPGRRGRGALFSAIWNRSAVPGMTRAARTQRIRDPLHNLIEFGNDDFEGALWRVIQAPPFQRLRRIRQLGFSELVYPGATHTRFAHSVGVFHTARRLTQI